ncbi:hypothetical protein RHGRI_029121 [Rhododendron griersonianum]|uniref:Uncharacterized protein n=1 Tax=Rhododendron griersonianum TaxID=479676 RepID=A0AAV6II36_9ERIC|nr:hypothetical protein RHGRI_029121 [Rhododendron griersonianum]
MRCNGDGKAGTRRRRQEVGGDGDGNGRLGRDVTAIGGMENREKKTLTGFCYWGGERKVNANGTFLYNGGMCVAVLLEEGSQVDELLEKARKVGSAQDWYPTIGVPGCYRTVGMPFANCVNLLVIDPFKLNFWLFIFLYGN